jgi:hypothetical protein
MNKIIGVLSGMKPLFQRLSIILMMMTLSRLLFYSFNSTSFASISFFDYCIGLWFDSMTLTIKKITTPDSLSFYKKNTKSVEKRIKAIIQRYNRDLIHNKMAVQ